MAGPVSMALGDFAFQALGFGYEDVRRRLDTRWASLPVAERFDALQFTGPASDELTISGVLFPEEWGGIDTLNALRDAAIRGDVLMLVTLNGDIRGEHVIEGISEDRSEHTARALPRRLAYRMGLRRYVRARTTT